jgi:hypothetical protein
VNLFPKDKNNAKIENTSKLTHKTQKDTLLICKHNLYYCNLQFTTLGLVLLIKCTKNTQVQSLVNLLIEKTRT